MAAMRQRQTIGTAVFGAAMTLAAAAAWAAPPCPAGALGTARTQQINTGSGAAIGLKTYPRTLDLAEREVVLTFDDGPLPGTTARVLDALAAECVKATFFLVGRNAQANPELVRRESAEGHTVGHHTFSHPSLTLRGLGDAAAKADIERGFAADDIAAYGSYGSGPRVKFFRFPGFGDTAPLLAALAGRGIAVFGADLWASDWLPMTPAAELALVLGRLEDEGRGIVLLHDTKANTAAMLPALLRALKARGFKVVHLAPGEGATPLRAAPPGWASETERTLARMWPKAAAGQ